MLTYVTQNSCDVLSACCNIQRATFPSVSHTRTFTKAGHLNVTEGERGVVAGELGNSGTGFWHVGKSPYSAASLGLPGRPQFLLRIVDVLKELKVSE